MGKINNASTAVFEHCKHKWEETDTGFGMDPDREDVVCKKCGCPGERWVETGEVDWPTT